MIGLRSLKYASLSESEFALNCTGTVELLDDLSIVPVWHGSQLLWSSSQSMLIWQTAELDTLWITLNHLAEKVLFTQGNSAKSQEQDVNWKLIEIFNRLCETSRIFFSLVISIVKRNGILSMKWEFFLTEFFHLVYIFGSPKYLIFWLVHSGSFLSQLQVQVIREIVQNVEDHLAWVFFL